ncbi:MAG: Gfo/Idh/MocA family oxidoreductase [Sedimentisphaerales bacterium]|nr:Gfo/Idh/MocA family oxidoreductase [Sedimentisphaerales bacterium]
MQSSISRRQLLKLGAAAVAAPMIVPSRLFGQNAPSEQVNLAVIGTGGKATNGMQNFINHTQAKVVALCDVNRNNLEKANLIAKVPKERCYEDFRDLLACSDIDAVLVGTPDHWHVPISIAAAQAGIDIYCEKPLSNTVAEGRALVNAVHKYKRIFQHGTQLRSQICTRKVCELVRNGYLGNVTKVVIGSPAGHATSDHPVQPVPEWLNWDLWQGPAQPMGYRPIIIGDIPGKGLRGWYFVSRFSLAGWMAGYGVHDIDLAQWGLGTENTGPVTVEGKGVFPESGLFNTVLTYDLEFTYADGRKIIITDTGKNRHGVTFHHENGKDWLYCRSDYDASDRDLLRIKLKDSDTHLYESNLHERNFIECVKSRKQTITPIDVAHRSTSICLIGGICLKLGRKLHWDPNTEKFINDDEANKLLSYNMRKPWQV